MGGVGGGGGAWIAWEGEANDGSAVDVTAVKRGVASIV